MPCHMHHSVVANAHALAAEGVGGRLVECVARAQTAQLVVLQVGVERAVAEVLGLAVLSVVDPAFERVRPHHSAQPPVERLPRRQAAQPLQTHLHEGPGEASQHAHGQREGEEGVDCEQHQGIDGLADLPAEAAELDLPLGVEVAVLGQHVEPHALHPVHRPPLVPPRRLHSQRQQRHHGPREDEPRGHDQRGVALLQLGQEGVEVEDGQREQEERGRVEGGGEERPQEQRPERRRHAAPHHPRRQAREQLQHPAHPQ